MKSPFMTVLASTFLLSGCAVHQVSGEVAGVDVVASEKGYSIKVNDAKRRRSSKHYYDGGQSFCPPGWRKKGACKGSN